MEEESAFALHAAVAGRDDAAMHSLLASGHSVNAADAGGATPLIIACSSHPAAVDALLAAGACVTARMHSGNGAAHYAAVTGCAEALRLLGSRSPEALCEPNKVGDTPGHMCCAAGGQPEALRALLRVLGEADEATHAASPSAAAAPSTRSRPAQSRLQRALSQANKHGDNMLHLACRAGAAGCVHVLLEAGADALARQARTGARASELLRSAAGRAGATGCAGAGAAAPGGDGAPGATSGGAPGATATVDGALAALGAAERRREAEAEAAAHELLGAGGALDAGGRKAHKGKAGGRLRARRAARGSEQVAGRPASSASAAGGSRAEGEAAAADEADGAQSGSDGDGDTDAYEEEKAGQAAVLATKRAEGGSGSAQRRERGEAGSEEAGEAGGGAAEWQQVLPRARRARAAPASGAMGRGERSREPAAPTEHPQAEGPTAAAAPEAAAAEAPPAAPDAALPAENRAAPRASHPPGAPRECAASAAACAECAAAAARLGMLSPRAAELALMPAHVLASAAELHGLSVTQLELLLALLGTQLVRVGAVLGGRSESLGASVCAVTDEIAAELLSCGVGLAALDETAPEEAAVRANRGGSGEARDARGGGGRSGGQRQRSWPSLSDQQLAVQAAAADERG